MRCTILEQDSSWDFAETLPFMDQATTFVISDVLTKDFSLICMIELNIVELAGVGLAVFTNLLKFDVAVWHLINGHVGVSHKTFHSELSGGTHLGESLLALSGCFVLSLLGKVFIDLLLALFIDELHFEGVEKSLLVSSHFLDLSESSCVSHGSRVSI